MRLIDAEEIEELFYKQVEYGATDLIDAFDDALQDARTVDAAEVLRDQWISVKDKLPETEEEVLVLTVSKTGNVNVDKGYLLNGRFVHRGSAVVTHWMPLPELPEVVKA